MSKVIGVDGCRGGWFAVIVELNDGRLQSETHVKYSSFCELLNANDDAEAIAVDIPIGLLDEPQPGGRECDIAARKLLDGTRKSSIFSPPSRRALPAKEYHEAHKLNGGMSRQAFGILTKIREVDELMTPELQSKVYEVHPELCFVSISGRCMQFRKKDKAGQAQRSEALKSVGFKEVDKAISEFRRSDAAVDDILDAYATAFTAVKIANGMARRISALRFDSKGLRMEMWL